jgi:hypothetical protein
MKEVRDSIVKILEHTSVADLCSRATRLEEDQEKKLDFVI